MKRAIQTLDEEKYGDDVFKIEYRLSGVEDHQELIKSLKSPKSYEPWRICFKVTLGSKILGEKINNYYGEEETEEGTEYQYTGHVFGPGILIHVVDIIMNYYDELSYGFGDGRFSIPLMYTPVDKHNVKIALDKEEFNHKLANFDIDEIQPVVIRKETASYEFLNLIDQLYEKFAQCGEQEYFSQHFKMEITYMKEYTTQGLTQSAFQRVLTDPGIRSICKEKGLDLSNLEALCNLSAQSGSNSKD